MSARRRFVQIASATAFIAIAALAVLIVVNQTQTDGGDADLEGVADVRRELAGIPQRGLELGAPDAAVRVLEFGDLRCPACAAVAEAEIPDLVESRVRDGSALLDFRNLPILGAESERAALAAIAAGEQDRGWAFVTLFFRNQGLEADSYVDEEFLEAVARGAGVADIGRWNRDRRGPAARSALAASESEAEALGFGSTPSFAVEGPGTDGPDPLEDLATAGALRAAIDEAASGSR